MCQRSRLEKAPLGLPPEGEDSVALDAWDRKGQNEGGGQIGRPSTIQLSAFKIVAAGGSESDVLMLSAA
jgi:hypothetical protein